MRSYRRNSAKRGRNDGSFWLSFSDLMSSLVLIIILVMFYMIYQYFNLAEINQAEIARRQYQLDEMKDDLDSQQTKLTEAEQKMISQQILLNAAQEDLEDAQAVLDQQKGDLESAQALLGEKETEIAAQQEKLNALSTQLNTQQSQLETQQSQLDDQQTQIEQLVGLKTRIISSLSSALKNNHISATVDPANGSIALESDVLFDSAKYELTEQGKRFVDEFLPIYLDVLFSEDYKDYVAEIIIEGHTDSDGSYIDNLKLSQRRALAVASYVLDDSYRAISGENKQQLRQVVTVNGRSFSDLIRTEAGAEDKDASRRVVFKFRLTDEQMIQQLQKILESE